MSYDCIDLHCDTIHALHEHPGTGSLLENLCQVNIDSLQAYGKIAVCFALFVDLEKSRSPFSALTELHDRFLLEVNQNKDSITFLKSAENLHDSNSLGAMLSCEELQVIEGDITKLGLLSSWGVRLATLTWNYENDLGFPHTMKGGLKQFGFSCIDEMERLGIMVDVSHLNDEGFWDVARAAKKPFLASHSNCRALTAESRNLTDEMIRAIAESGGVVGLNFCHLFLGSHSPASHLEALVAHAKHLKKVGGCEVLAIGTDFDGITTKDLCIENHAEMGRLWKALSKALFKGRELELMFSGNALRVLGGGI